MNGVHDLGGMHGFGPIEPSRTGAPYREDWERRIFALDMACDDIDLGDLACWRHTIECMPAVEYLRASYYERWLHGLETRLIVAGVVTPEQIAARMSEIAGAVRGAEEG